jgi:transposase
MFRVRKVPTKSNATAIQVVKSGGHDVKLVKHIGSAHSPQKINDLISLAHNWISNHNPQLPLFPQPPPSTLVSVDNLELVNTIPTLIHQLCMQSISLFGFDKLLSQVLLDLVFIRLVEPASKSASINLLSCDFGLVHKLKTLQRHLKNVANNKTAIEACAVTYAKKYLAFDFKVVFYDVTTLYYESFKADRVGEGVKLPGFSKDNKFNQPQIVLGLVVTKEGFPLEFRIFAGNKFEGHTLIPVLEQLKRHHQIKTLTVVADAAMISDANVKALKQKKLGYIVGARLASLGKATIKTIDSDLKRIDKQTIRLETSSKGWLICQFSKKRFAKDKHETKKQVERAKRALKQPGKAVKRLKFVKKQKRKGKDKQAELQLNLQLLEKAKKLWGIKGYYTDQKDLTDQQVIDHYHSLWQVEKAFRISKSDLQVRPIYHRKTQNIMAHLIICFMALCIAKHWEMKTGTSIKKLIKILRNISDAQFQDRLTGKTFTLRRKLTPQETSIVENLS